MFADAHHQMPTVPPATAVATQTLRGKTVITSVEVEGSGALEKQGKLGIQLLRA